MRTSVSLVALAGLLLAATFAVQAAKPVDNDLDGYTNNRDCNDNDPDVWELNSCGLCEPEPDPAVGCGGGTTTCTDDDQDGYALEGGDCGPIDCNDGDPTVNPGAAEVCTDAIDNNCDGTINEGCSTSERNVIVVATNDLGMHCACPGSEYFMLLPPFNTFRAQVIERGGQSPVVLDDPNDIRVEYDVVENTDESLQADPYYSTWLQMMPKYGFGSAFNADGKIQGLLGATLDGEMEAKTGEGWWEVVGVPVFPDVSDNSAPEDKVMVDALGQGNPNRNPYLSVNVNVYDQNGTVDDKTDDTFLATTTTVAPVAFGGCCNCHLDVTTNNTGISNPTPKDSFEEMGRLHSLNGSGINIAQINPDGDSEPGPVRCSVCHLDPAMGESYPGELTHPDGYLDPNADQSNGPQYLAKSSFTFSDVLHRGHLQNPIANQMDENLAINCYNCHPGNGVNCFRGHHLDKDGANGTMWCTDCHGDPTQRVAEGQLLNPWSDQTLPSCEDCHNRTGELDSGDDTYLHLGVFGKYLNSRGHKNDKILCSTCHGAPHALYPSHLAKDNDQVFRLQGLTNPIGVCDTCHVGKRSTYSAPQH